jgi:hypothetical protein
VSTDACIIFLSIMIELIVAYRIPSDVALKLLKTKYFLLDKAAGAGHGSIRQYPYDSPQEAHR